MHAKIENGQVVEYPIINLRQRLPDISLPADLSDDALLPDGFVFINFAAPPLVASNQKVAPSQPVQQNGQWVQNWVIVDMPQDEIEARLTAYAQQVRQDRNDKLKDSDWTQLADAPVDQAAWASYRQALRDVTAQSGFPLSVEWPAQPE